MNLRTLLLLPLLAGTAPASSQSQTGTWLNGQSVVLPFEPENRIPWPHAFGATPDFGRSVVLEFDGDQVLDAAVLANGLPYVLWQPAYYDWVAPITFPTAAAPSNVRDMATLPVGDSATPDHLLLTDSRGLYKTSWNGTNFVDPTVIATGRWVNAGPFRSVDLNADGITDLVGRAGDGLAAVVRYGNTSGGFNIGPTLVPSSGAGVIDVVGVKWSGLTGRAVAVLCTDGMRVYDLAGQVVLFEAHAQASGCLIRFRRDASSDELLAWTRPSVSGTTSELVVLGAGIEEGPTTLFFDDVANLGPFWTKALLAGNYDDDGDDELLLVHPTHAYAVVLENLGDPDPLDPESRRFNPASDSAHDMIKLSAVPPLVSGTGIPTMANLTLSGPDDFLFPVSSVPGASELVVFRTLAYNRTGLSVAGTPPDSADIFAPHSEYEAVGTGTGTFRLALFVPANYAQYTHIDLKLWYEPGEGVGANAVPLRWTKPLNPQGVHQYLTVPFAFDPTSDPTWLCWDPKRYYYYELRFYKQSPLSYSPKFFGGFTLQQQCQTNNTTFTQWLNSKGIPGASYPLLQYNGITDPDGLPDQTLLGNFVPMSSAPTFESTPVQQGEIITLQHPLATYDPNP